MKAIFFDLDDTLMNHSQAFEAALAEVLHRRNELADFYTAQSLTATWKASLKVYYDGLPSTKLPERQRRAMGIRSIWTHAGLELSDEDCGEVVDTYLHFYKSCWSAHTDVEKSLNALKRFHLGVITNGHVQQQNDKLRRCEIDHHFQTVITSEEAGTAKPDPRIFEIACKRIGVHPWESVYVGDLLDIDAIAASQAGLQGIWLNRSGQPAEKPVPRNVREIRSLSEL